MLPENIHLEKPSRQKRISRREMLKLSLTGAAGLVFGPLVSACSGLGAQPAPTNTPTATSAPTATSTPAATNTLVASNSGKRLINSKTVSAKDGRKICYLEAGKPDGIPVVALHGQPGCRMLYDPWVEDATSRGIRLIGYDRPGYGGSTSYPGRSVASAVDDVATLAKELGLSKFFVWGISGGGPHALACAALLPDLVVAVAALAPIAPYNAVGLDWWGGMNTDNVNEFQIALKGKDALLNLLSGVPSYYASVTPEVFFTEARSSFPQAEAAAWTKDLSNFFLDYNREAIRDGLDGWVDDDIAFTTPWGFELSQIQIPVMLMQGDQDWYVPFAHGKWLAGKIKNVETHFIPGEGHLAMLNHVPEAHTYLLSKMN